MNLKLLVALSLVILLSSWAPNPAAAGAKPDLVIVAEDSDTDSLPRSIMPFHRVVRALENHLLDAGFGVYDETAVFPGLDQRQERVSREDAELIDAAKSDINSPIDVVVILSLYANARDLGYAGEMSLNAKGRLLNVRTGERLGNIELPEPLMRRVTANCSRECLFAEISGQADTLARGIAGELIAILPGAVGSGAQQAGNQAILGSGYSLIFQGFDPEEWMMFEEYLVLFSGYISHDLKSSDEQGITFWYESDIESGRLTRNLQRMVQEAGIPGVVILSGMEFTVTKAL